MQQDLEASNTGKPDTLQLANPLHHLHQHLKPLNPPHYQPYPHLVVDDGRPDLSRSLNIENFLLDFETLRRTCLQQQSRGTDSLEDTEPHSEKAEEETDLQDSLVSLGYARFLDTLRLVSMVKKACRCECHGHELLGTGYWKGHMVNRDASQLIKKR